MHERSTYKMCRVNAFFKSTCAFLTVVLSSMVTSLFIKENSGVYIISVCIGLHEQRQHFYILCMLEIFFIQQNPCWKLFCNGTASGNIERSIISFFHFHTFIKGRCGSHQFLRYRPVAHAATENIGLHKSHSMYWCTAGRFLYSTGLRKRFGAKFGEFGHNLSVAVHRQVHYPAALGAIRGNFFCHHPAQSTLRSIPSLLNDDGSVE